MAFVSYPDPRLAKRAEPAPVDAALLATGERLLLAAAEVRAYGLAAAHIGENAPVIVLNTGDAEHPVYGAYYNPVVEAEAGEAESGREASVSLPGVEADIARPIWADIAWQDAEGGAHRERMTGFIARCALHEIEQMNGRFFLMNLSRLKREALLKKARKRRD